MRQNNRRKHYRSHHGLTMIEMLIVALLAGVMIYACFSLLKGSWQSYDNLHWQSRVNMEARRALDDICYHIRMSGSAQDMTYPALLRPQVEPASDSQVISIKPIGRDSEIVYQTATKNATSYYGKTEVQSFLVRVLGQGENANVPARFIKNIEFEYEYRLPSLDENDATWRSVRVSNPQFTDAIYLAHTIYVTVTAESPRINGQIYTRRLTSAVRLRTPYNTQVPLATYSPYSD